MSWLDRLVFGLQILSGGSALTQRPKLNFVSGATCADNPTEERTDVTVTGVAPTVAVSSSTTPAALTAARWQVAVSRGASGAVTYYLPASPSVGDVVEFWIQDRGDSAHDLTANGNGSNINGAALALTIGPPTVWLRCLYVDSTTGWATTSGK